MAQAQELLSKTFVETLITKSRNKNKENKMSLQMNDLQFVHIFFEI
jgi:hypothetical protein